MAVPSRVCNQTVQGQPSPARAPRARIRESTKSRPLDLAFRELATDLSSSVNYATSAAQDSPSTPSKRIAPSTASRKSKRAKGPKPLRPDPSLPVPLCSR